MSNVIQFLESMGRAPLSGADYAACVAALDVNATQQRALMDRDHAALNTLLDGRSKLYCLVAAAEEEI